MKMFWVKNKFGVLAGMGAVFIFLNSAAAPAEETRELLDLDKDGKMETVRITDNGVIQREETDTNADGKTDRTLYYQKGFRHHRDSDNDHDGKIDKWELYTARGIKQIVRKDTNGDGQFDRSNFLLQSTSVILREYDKNFDGKVDRRDVARFDFDKSTQMFRYLYDWKEEDSDYDGKIDVYRVRHEPKPNPDKTGQAIDAVFREIVEPEEPKPKGDADEGVKRLLKERSGFEDLLEGSRESLKSSDAVSQ